MPAPSAPLLPLTRNCGNGTMEVQWEAPISGVVDHYDVYISTSELGSYEKANKAPITVRMARVQNLVFGYTIYTKVKAVHADGAESPFSAVANNATADKATLRLTFTGPSDDIIAQRAMFAASHNGELIAVETLDEGTIV